MKTKLFKFADGIAHYGEETGITQQLFNAVYNHRNKNSNWITGFNNVAATALVFSDEIMIIGIGASNQTKSRTGEDDRNNHAERESLVAAIVKASVENKQLFNELFPIHNQAEIRKAEKEIKELLLSSNLPNQPFYLQLSQEKKDKQRQLLQALGSLSQVVTYSEREFCDFKPPQQEGCKTYLETLANRCNQSKCLGFYSISKEIRNECSKELIDRLVSEEIQRLAFSTNYDPSDKEILCKAIFDNINKSISEINKLYASFGRVGGRGLIPAQEQKLLAVMSSQLIEQIHSDLADPRKTIELYRSTTASTSTASELAQKLAAVEGQFAQTEDISLKMQKLFQSALENDKKGITKSRNFRQNLDDISKNIPNLIEKIENQLKLNTSAEQQPLVYVNQQLNELQKLIKQYTDNSTKSKSNIRSDIVKLINNINIKPKQIAAITKEGAEGEIEPADSSSELLGSVARQSLDPWNDDLVLEQAKLASLQIAKNKGEIGPLSIDEWELRDIEDEGNCFYDAVIHQMQYVLREDQQNQTIRIFMSDVPAETLHRDSLRLNIQGRAFKDGEWADTLEIEKVARNFNAVVAIVDTRGDRHNFIYHYIDGDGQYQFTNHIQDPALSGQSIIKLAFNGNHYLSVVSHPDLNLQHSVAGQPPTPIPEPIAAADNFEPSSTVVPQPPQPTQQAEIVAILDTLNEKIDNLKQLSVHLRQQKRLKGQLLEEICKLVDEGKIKTGQNPEQKKTFEMFSILANRLQPLKSLLPYNDKNGWQIIELGTQILQQSITDNMSLFKPADPPTPVSKSEAVSEKQKVTLDDLNQFIGVAQQLATAPAQPPESVPKPEPTKAPPKPPSAGRRKPS